MTEQRANGATKKRFKLKWPFWGLVLLLLAGLSPLISALSSGAIAEAFGCALDEGGVHPCVVFGHDLGEALNVMFVLGWLQLMTWPAVGIALLGLFILALIALWRWLRG